MRSRTFVSITAAPILLALLLSPMSAFHVASATLVVDGTADASPPNTTDGICSLREAMQAVANRANFGNCVNGGAAYGTSDTINFNIAGAGVHTINAVDTMPAITRPVLIDGYSQPGASANTMPVGGDAQLTIEINCAAISSLFAELFDIQGGGGSTIRGLVANRALGPIVQIGSPPSNNNTIAGNYFGVDATGTTFLNGTGTVIVISGSSNTIGGTTPAARNVIASRAGVNAGTIQINSVGSSAGNLIQGNYIGVNAAGTAAVVLSGSVDGVEHLSSGSNTIGGTTPGAGNVIVASNNAIRAISGSGGLTIQGNLIGTNATGTAPLGSGLAGIDLGSPGHVIGGPIPGAGNVISGFAFGVRAGSESSGTIIRGNRIGTDVTGTADIGNRQCGILADPGGPGLTIGGIGPGDGNVIAFNGTQGVSVNSGSGTSILGNSIFANGGMGISFIPRCDLALNVVTQNDIGDGDNGANNVQNFPIIAAAMVSGGNATISGTLNSTPSTTFRVEFFASASCDASGNGEGQTFLGATPVTTDSSGNVSFGPLPFAVKNGQSVFTATATDPGNNTSEFSPCFGVPTLSITDVSADEGNSGTTQFVFTVALSGVGASPANVAFATTDGTAVAGNDYVATSGTLTFSAGVTTQTITVDVIGDTALEPDETFFVNVSVPADPTIPAAQARGTVRNDDGTTTTTLVSDVNPAAFGQTVTFTATVFPPSATGTVTFADGPTPIGTGALFAGTATFATSALAFGTHSVTATYGGATDFLVSTSAPLAQVVDPQPPAPSLSINSVSTAEGASASSEPFVFTVTLSHASTDTVAVTFATSDGTATVADGDYAATSGTLSFDPGVTTQAININVNGDSKFEANETFFVNLSAPLNATIATGQGIGTIVNDDVAPALSISNVSQFDGDIGFTPFTFTVSLSAESGVPVTVAYATADGSAQAVRGDYTATSGTLTFAPGVTSQTITVDVRGGRLFSGNDQTFFVNLSAPANATIAAGHGIGTIVANVIPVVSINNVSFPEGNSGLKPFVFTVTLSTASNLVVTVDYATADDIASVADNDYIPTSGTLTFQPGITTQTITVNVVGDLNFEEDETFAVNVSGGTNGSFSQPQRGLGTIVNDDPAPTVSSGNVTAREGDSGVTPFAFPLRLSNPSAFPIVVALRLSPDIGFLNLGDYSQTVGAVTFAPGETVKTATVNVFGDTVFEPDETLLLFLNIQGGGATVATPQVVGTILNDDPPPTITIDNVTGREGSSGTSPAEGFIFSVTLSNASQSTVSVNFATADGTATITDGDYFATSGTLSFLPGETAKEVIVLINGDTKVETVETLFVNLTAPVNASIAKAQGIGTILNDDSPPTISINDVRANEGNSGVTPFVFTVSLSNPSDMQVSVDFATANSTAIAGRDYVATGGTLIFPPGATTRTITVGVNGDTSPASDETFFVNLSAPTNATIAKAQGLGTIQNDDGAFIPLVFQGASSIHVHGSRCEHRVSLSQDPRNPTTEPRLGPTHMIAFSFNIGVTAATASVTEGKATAGTPTFQNGTVYVPLEVLIDRQYVTIGLTNLVPTVGEPGGTASVRIGFLVGDVNSDRVVSSTDVSAVKARAGQAIDNSNFVFDLNATGVISASDVVAAKARATGVPLPP